MTCSSYFLALSRTLVGPIVHSWPSRKTFQEPLNGQKVSINDLIFNVYCHFHVAFSPQRRFPPNRIRSKKSKIKNQHRFRALTFLIPILRKKKLSKRLFSCKFFNIIQDMIFFFSATFFWEENKGPWFFDWNRLWKKSPEGTNHLGLF